MIYSGGSSLVALTALLQRVVHRLISPDADVKQRAVRFRDQLNRAAKLTRETAIINAIWDLEVLNEDSALIPECLDLQLRFLELASDNAKCANWASEELGRAPLAKLYKAIVEQASSDEFQSARLVLGKPFYVDYGRGTQWENAMEIPQNLRLPMLGFATRLQGSGLEPMRQFAGWDFISSLSVEISDSDPKVVTLRWTDGSVALQ